MSRTHKDKPFKVRLEMYPEVMEISHSDDCVTLNGPLDCDAPIEVMVDGLGPMASATRCHWFPNFSSLQGLKLLDRGMPKHGCDHERCTDCTAKKTLKRRTRNKLKRDLKKEITEF